jgi:hypothetical protein
MQIDMSNGRIDKQGGVMLTRNPEPGIVHPFSSNFVQVVWQ